MSLLIKPISYKLAYELFYVCQTHSIIDLNVFIQILKEKNVDYHFFIYIDLYQYINSVNLFKIILKLIIFLR